MMMRSGFRYACVLLFMSVFLVQSVRADDEVDTISVDTTTMAALFRSMPDSLMPYLSHNNRLDLLDFIESGMEAKVTNLLDGETQLVSLAVDSLVLQMSPTLRTDLLLLPVDAASADSIQQVVCMLNTYGADSDAQETAARFYTVHWESVPFAPHFKKAEKQRIEALRKQRKFKFYDRIINKQ